MLDRDDPVVPRRHRPVARAEHEGNARAIDIAVTEADPGAAFFQGDREIRRHCRFADAALTARDGDDVADPFNARGAHSRRSRPGRGRVNIDQDFCTRDPWQRLQDCFRFRFDGLRNRGLVRGQRQLHGD